MIWVNIINYLPKEQTTYIHRHFPPFHFLSLTSPGFSSLADATSKPDSSCHRWRLTRLGWWNPLFPYNLRGHLCSLYSYPTCSLWKPIRWTWLSSMAKRNKWKSEKHTMVHPCLIPERLVLWVQPSSALLEFSQYPADYSILKQRGSNKNDPNAWLHLYSWIVQIYQILGRCWVSNYPIYKANNNIQYACRQYLYSIHYTRCIYNRVI